MLSLGDVSSAKDVVSFLIVIWIVAIVCLLALLACVVLVCDPRMLFVGRFCKKHTTSRKARVSLIPNAVSCD